MHTYKCTRTTAITTTFVCSGVGVHSFERESFIKYHPYSSICRQRSQKSSPTRRGRSDSAKAFSPDPRLSPIRRPSNGVAALLLSEVFAPE